MEISRFENLFPALRRESPAPKDIYLAVGSSFERQLRRLDRPAADREHDAPADRTPRSADPDSAAANAAVAPTSSAIAPSRPGDEPPAEAGAQPSPETSAAKDQPSPDAGDAAKAANEGDNDASSEPNAKDDSDVTENDVVVLAPLVQTEAVIENDISTESDDDGTASDANATAGRDDSSGFGPIVNDDGQTPAAHPIAARTTAARSVGGPAATDQQISDDVGPPRSDAKPATVPEQSGGEVVVEADDVDSAGAVHGDAPRDAQADDDHDKLTGALDRPEGPPHRDAAGAPADAEPQLARTATAEPHPKLPNRIGAANPGATRRAQAKDDADHRDASGDHSAAAASQIPVTAPIDQSAPISPDGKTTPVNRPLAKSKPPRAAGAPVAAIEPVQAIATGVERVDVQADEAKPATDKLTPSTKDQAHDTAPDAAGPHSPSALRGSVHGGSSSPAADAARPVPTIDHVRFVQRIARAIHSHGQGNGEIRMRLSPPELGSLRIEMSMKNGVLAARFEAETPAARNLLLDHLSTLRDRLAEQNVKVARLDVDLMGGDAGGQYHTSSRDAYARPEAPPPRNAASPPSKPSPPPPIRPAPASVALGDGSLNVVV